MSHLASLASSSSSAPSPASSTGYAVYQAHKRQRVDPHDPTKSPSDASAAKDQAKSGNTSPTDLPSGPSSSGSASTSTSGSASAPAFPPLPLGLQKEPSWSVLDNADSFGGLGAMPSVALLEKRQFSITSLLPPSLASPAGLSASTSASASAPGPQASNPPSQSQSIAGSGGNQKYLNGATGEYMYRDDVNPMTFPEKEALVQKITLLPSQYLRGLMDVISKYQPDTMRQIDDDGYAFDLGQMNENTVWAISDYVKDSMTELDGYIRSISAASMTGEETQHVALDAAGNPTGNPMAMALAARHPAHNLSLNNPKINAISNNENQGKFLEQVEMYSKPKVTKSRVKPSKKHECPTCQKQFRGRSELQNHIRTHTGEKPLKCSFPGCTKRYAHSSNLRAHERTHQGIKPYACHYDGCGKSFAHSVSLKEHIWMHAGFQPYVCPFDGCEKRFTQVSNFARHKKTHEKEERRDATL